MPVRCTFISDPVLVIVRALMFTNGLSQEIYLIIWMTGYEIIKGYKYEGMKSLTFSLFERSELLCILLDAL